MTSITTENPFIEYQQPILMAAAAIYRAEREGVEVDPDASRVMVLPRNLGEVSIGGFIEDEALRSAVIAEAEVNVSARAVARLALLQDDIDKGGVVGVFAKIETAFTRVMERKYTKDALASGLIEQIRGKSSR